MVLVGVAPRRSPANYHVISEQAKRLDCGDSSPLFWRTSIRQGGRFKA
jgi:hypothetical protein